MFQRGVFLGRLKDFFASRGVSSTAPVMQRLRDTWRSTLEAACGSALLQRVFSVAAEYHKASLEVNREVCGGGRMHAALTGAQGCS